MVLHWLPVHYQVQFEILVHGPTLHYMSELLHPYASVWAMRACDKNRLIFPSYKTKD